jgi:two-component system sensor histidine kinase RegB
MSVAMRVDRLDTAASTKSTLETPVLAGHRRADTRTDTEVQLGLSWLLKLRWGAVGGQLLALVLVRVILALDLPYVPLLGLVTFTAASNAVLTFVGQPTTSSWRLPAVLAVDVAVLTVMLAASGGASNPFTVFFLVHVALAALLLEARLAWAVVALTVVAFGALFFVPAQHLVFHEHGPWSTHLIGMWIAYVLAAGFVAYFVGRVSRAIRDRDRRLAEIASLGAQNERLATLSSFSANAAHELGSPLATIGLAAKELALGIRRESPDSALSSDADLVCREVARCREILADISARAGESVGEMPVRATPPRVLEDLRRLMAPALVPHLEITYASEPSKQAVLVAPIKTLAQMLHNLIRNAFEAQEDADVLTPVELRIEAGERLCFHVLDRGAGLTHEVRAKLGEPFVTTKADRGGLGLGVYLARSYAERTGGYLLFQAREGGGSDVELCLPRDAVRGDA